MLPLLLTVLVDQAPEPEDVTAGWTALVVFLLLIAAVVFLGFSLVKQLRKAQAAEEAGVFDDAGKRASKAAEQPADERADKPADQ